MQVRKTMNIGTREPELLKTEVISYNPSFGNYTVRVLDKNRSGEYDFVRISSIPAPGKGRLSGPFFDYELVDTSDQ